MDKSQEIIKQLQDEKQWLEEESKRQVEESERKLENVRAGELQELRRGKVEALQLLQVSSLVASLLLSDYNWHLAYRLHSNIVMILKDISAFISLETRSDLGN